MRYLHSKRFECGLITDSTPTMSCIQGSHVQHTFVVSQTSLIQMLIQILGLLVTTTAGFKTILHHSYEPYQACNLSTVSKMEDWQPVLRTGSCLGAGFVVLGFFFNAVSCFGGSPFVHCFNACCACFTKAVFMLLISCMQTQQLRRLTWCHAQPFAYFETDCRTSIPQ